MDSTEREAIIGAVTARVRSFEAAERARDAEQLIAHWLWRKIDGQWLIAHGHISHPLEPAK